MTANYLHQRKDFLDLIKVIADQKSIEPFLFENDYWVMHVLYGLRKQGFDFELKGGTSPSKGYGIISRFSEDIDIAINPPANLPIKLYSGRNHTKEAHD